MQCVILAAGKGTRMLPLTEKKPKPLIEVGGKPILQHIVESLPVEIDEIVMVVGYKAEMIREYCGKEYFGKRIVYVEQKDHAGGTGDALLCAKDFLKGKFLFMFGDDIHGAGALKDLVKEEHAILSFKSDKPEHFGVIVTNEDGTLKEILEKPVKPPSDLINIGGFVIGTEIFNYKCEASELGEVLITDMLTLYAKDHPVKVLNQDIWMPVGCPEDIGRAEALLNEL